MSTSTVTPSLNSRRVAAALSPVNLHIAGVMVLLALNIYLAVHLFLAWNKLRQSGSEAVSQQQVALKTADIAAQPLRGLDDKLTTARAEADKFAEQRLPYAYSSVAAELGALAKKENVRLTRVQYTPTAPEDSPDPDLIEIRMDATLSGDYRPLMQFLNAVERDKMFFLIGAVTFTGQAGGGNNNNAPATSVVNLRLRLTTYLRKPLPSDAKQEASTKPEGSTKQEAGHEVRR